MGENSNSTIVTCKKTKNASKLKISMQNKKSCYRCSVFYAFLNRIYALHVATTLDNNNLPIRDAFDKIATPFDYGSGHIRPNLAMDPGLVYDMRLRDYLNFICAHDHNKYFLKYFNRTSYNCPKSYSIENLNYPSITVANRGMNSINVTRTVTNVGTPTSTYVVIASIVEGFKVLVQPSSLTFKTLGEKKSFRVILQGTSFPSNGFPVFGNLSWTDGNHTVTSPIVVL